MSKIHRGDLSYSKVYKNMDLNKDLGVNWEEAEGDNGSGGKRVKKVEICTEPEPLKYMVDEFDLKFIKESEMTENEFVEEIKGIEQEYATYLKKKMDKITLLEANGYCDICGYSDDSNENKMVVCQGCGIPVHQSCYGVGEFTKAWLCKKCEEGEFDSVCGFCTEKDGILKKTDQNEWIHAICAICNPTICFLNDTLKEPVDMTNYEPVNGKCVLCKKKSNDLMECSFLGCENAFHVTCACGLLYIDIDNSTIYCKKHFPIKDPTEINSRKETNEMKDGYRKMKDEIYERDDMRLNAIIETEYSQLVKTSLNEFKTECSNTKLVEYYKSKQMNIGRSAIDYYQCANAFREAFK
ncbi:BRPF1 [Enterospora canceri]|uniref:BRPF1 n=1 Tax=Enterospora canceri TaxID=1081671 RepID=A0A1Y1S619_9MICR|nr:BRPF1 [Enterospora canceri]